MKCSLSFTLLTINFFILSILPVTAANVSIRVNDEAKKTKLIEDGQWCVRIPVMGLFCWDL